MKDKWSNYNVISDEFLDSNRNITQRVIFNTRSGNKLVITQEQYRHISNKNIDKLSDTLLSDLYLGKFLISEHENELANIISENLKAIENDKTLFIAIQPTANCQLGCDYCGQQHKNKRITSIYMNRIIERVNNKLQDSKYEKLEVGWFGAEPLINLSAIRTLSRQFISLTSDLNIEYSASVVTNGINLSPSLANELYKDYKVEYAEITLDGTENFHDSRRMYKNGSRSFNKILKNIDSVVKSNCGLNIRIRCNVDKRNLDGVIQLLDVLQEQEIHKKIKFYTAPIRSWGNDVSSIALDMETFARWEILWYLEMYKRGMDVSIIPTRKKIVCMAVRKDSELYDTFGDIFNCSEVSYIAEYEISQKIKGGSKNQFVNRFSLGKLENGIDKDKKKELGNFNLDIKGHKFPCYSCQMLPVCGGSCPKSWKEGGVACPPSKFNIKQKLVLDHFFELKLKPSFEIF